MINDKEIERLSRKRGWRYAKELGLVFEGKKPSIARRNKLDCPYRDHALSDEQTCSTSFGCSKGFDPDNDQTILADIPCWVDQGNAITCPECGAECTTTNYDDWIHVKCTKCDYEGEL